MEPMIAWQPWWHLVFGPVLVANGAGIHGHGLFMRRIMLLIVVHLMVGFDDIKGNNHAC